MLRSLAVLLTLCFANLPVLHAAPAPATLITQDQPQDQQQYQQQQQHQYQHQQQRAPVFGNVVPTSAILRHGGAVSASPPLRTVSGVVGTSGAGVGVGVTATYASPGSSPGSSASAPRSYGTTESRRERAEQVRLAVTSPHTASALGMRV